MRHRVFLIYLLGVLMGTAMLTSCQDDWSGDEHYQVPEWLKGNAYEVLEKDGNYSIFLEGIDSAGFKPMVTGKSILTVMAPNDDAFRTYLQSRGYESIKAMYNSNPQEVKKLIGFHLMYYAFKWNMLVNFRPEEGDGATEEQLSQWAGLYYKHRTKSSDPISKMYGIKDMNADGNADSVLIYHPERFLPVFSTKFFETKGIEAKYNYEYFYPNSEWTGSNYPAGRIGGFNVSNASVVGDQVITDNGYLYHINQVLIPLETIYTELKNRANYSDFLSLYDTYSEVLLDPELTRLYGNGEDLYLHGHGDLPPIAYEWPTSDYKQMNALSRDAYNIFAPSNEAIDRFFTNYWTAESGYTSLSDLDPLILYYFIFQSFSNSRFPVFPEEIKNGTVVTPYETPINIDPDMVTDRVICVNGMLYGMENMDPPAIFSSVIGPAFKEARFAPFLYSLDGSELILSLASQNSNFVALIPDTAQYTANLMRLNITSQGKQLEVWNDEAGAYVEMSSSQMRDIVSMHVSANADSLATEGIQVVPSEVPFNYWYVVDGKITTSALFNEQLNPTFQDEIFSDFQPLQNNGSDWDNGKAYAYSYDKLYQKGSGDNLEHYLAVCNDKNYPYYCFSQLLRLSGLIDTETEEMSILGPESRFVAFIPNNEAIAKNLANIPGASGLSIDANYKISGKAKTDLADYLKGYFIVSELNPFDTYPYPGSGFKGTFDTHSTYGPNNKLNICVNDDGKNITVQFEGNAPASLANTDVYHSLPFAYSDGCFHLINDILRVDE